MFRILLLIPIIFLYILLSGVILISGNTIAMLIVFVLVMIN